MGKKYYVSYNQLHKIIQSKVKDIKEFDPEVIVAIGGGGYIPARITRSFISVPIVGIGIQLYDSNDQIHKDGPKKFQWLDQNAIDHVKGKRVLIVDEVDDTRTTLEYTVKELAQYDCKEIGVFVLHNKEKKKNDLNVKVYIAGESVEGDRWIVYPWEASDIEEHDKLSLQN